MNIRCIVYLAVALIFTCTANASTFYDDFSDNDISDWGPRCVPGNWSVYGGMVHGNTSSSPSFLTPQNAFAFQNGEISVSTKAVHVSGICARLDDEDSGIYAYVSPDANVARIRLCENGVQSTIYNSIYANFPSNVMYELTLTCEGENLTLTIEVPSTSQTWILNAVDPNPHSGNFAFHMGDEPNALWDWIEVEGTGIGYPEITWMTTNDQSLGNSNFAFEPGETIDLDIQLTNKGEEYLTNAFAVLQPLNSELAVIEDYVSYGTLSPGQSSTGTSSFMVLAPLVTPADEVYPMRLTLMADGGYQEQLLFSLPVGNGLVSDVESGEEDWSWESLAGGWANNWHVSSERNFTSGGQYSFKCGDIGSGDYSNHHYASLSSPLINLPLSTEVSFWMWIDAQTQDLPLALDGGLIQYGRCGNWIDLFPVSGYTHQVSSGSTGPFEDGSQVFSGTESWKEYIIAIPDSLAGPGQIRFVFGSDDDGTREGWYLDDISIEELTSIEEPDETVVFTDVSLCVSENPFFSSLVFSYQLPGLTDSRLEILDIAGRLIYEVDITPGNVVATHSWNGRSASGEQIPPGVYLAKLSGYDQTAIKLIKL